MRKTAMAKFEFRTLSIACALLAGATIWLALAPAQAQSSRVGVTSVTEGDPLGKPPAMPERVLRVGTDVQANEVITTTNNDRAHLIFLDGTTLTVGPNAQFTIDKFVYDPDTKKGQLAISASKGVFRLVGGRISKSDAITVTTPSSTLGIRGGIMIFGVDSGQTFSLLVYGDIMYITAGGVTETVTWPGTQVSTKAGNVPGPATFVLQGDLSTALQALVGTPGATALGTALEALIVSHLPPRELVSQIQALLQSVINQNAPSTLGTTTTINISPAQSASPG
jgi:hypothetical protein